MTPGAGVLLILLGASGPLGSAYAADVPAVEGVSQDPGEADLIRRTQESLAADPARADALAARLLRSRVGRQLSEADEPGKARAEVLSWISANPESAATLAVGFAKDDARRSRAFEESLFRQVERFFELNPGRSKGILGRLDQAAAASKTLQREVKLDEEQQRQLIQQLFEGRSAGAGQGPSGPEGKGGGGKSESAGTPVAAGLYDRLHAANLTGYSPQVMALQSEMNRLRAPGAPKLVETGRLDYETLRYPAYGLRYDLDRLEKSWRIQRAWAQARSLGEEGRVSGRDLASAEVQADLERRARAAKIPESPAAARRRKALDAVAAALRDFAAEAERTREPKGIRAERLRRLSELRREAARWIAVASLDETLGLLESLRGFLTPLLQETIAKVPVEEDCRRAYRGRGRALERGLEGAIATGGRARSLLAEGTDDASWAEAERLIAASRAAARRFPTEISEFRETPGRALGTQRSVSRLRALVDDAALRFAPGLAYSRRLAKQRQDARAALDAFRRIADPPS
ncbi:MAG: hypothetical protein A2X36_15505 [Elusimicrobia bacterium GWA2_69_24]|nr:MAG: hypothetical protein A2X36_15505 [Elusimicrobia bacterium GWA2_69_24]HBL18121.1 hypothetical protein [Elusimicrobiota bacterium]